MSNVGPFFSWKCHVICLMRDQGLPLRLTPTEVDRLENFFYWGLSPEEFVETLKKIEMRYSRGQGLLRKASI